jgi:beta-N-acetylhexosaminidase
MSDHIAVPSVADGSTMPGSVEPKLATFWLREKLGFKGVLISDDMWYEKVIDRFGKVESCIMAIKAGHDAILKPGDAMATVSGLADAVRAGEIPEEQIDNSVKKLLYWKARLNLHKNRYVDEDKVASSVAIKAHQEFLHKLADLSLTVLKNDGFFPTDANKIGNIFHLCIQRKEIDSAPSVVSAKMNEAFSVQASAILRPDASYSVYTDALNAAKEADTVIVSLFNPRTRYIDNGPLRKKDLDLIQRIIRIKPKSTVVMSYGNPYPAESLKNATAFVLGYGEGGFYGNQIVYADSFIRLLKGEISPRGKLPVTVSETFPLGTGVVF